MQISLAFAILGVCIGNVIGHGYMINPAARNSMWRAGFKTPANYNDMAQFCGGFSHQWTLMGGKCGVCGDPYKGNLRHEVGGKYATDTIAKCYAKSKKKMTVTIRITAHHKGYFEFRLCPNDKKAFPVTQECLDQTVLTVSGTDSTRYNITNLKLPSYTFDLDIPEGVTCSRCMLQWLYNTGNNWGCDFNDPTICGQGLGPQEQFVNCADISILDDCSDDSDIDDTTEQTTTTDTWTDEPPSSTTTTTTATTTAAAQTTTTTATTTTTPAPTTTESDEDDDDVDTSNCKAIAPFDTIPGYDSFCRTRCAMGTAYCPISHCTCDQPIDSSPLLCVAIGPFDGDESKNKWCEDNCNHNPPYCPQTYCFCIPLDLLKKLLLRCTDSTRACALNKD